MKTLVQNLKWLCLTLVAVFMAVQLHAQESQMFMVHEDMVYPSKVAEYEAASKKFTEVMEQQNATDAAYLAVSLDDHRYLFVSAIEDYAAIDNNPLEEVAKSIGEDFDKMMANFDGTYETHRDYVIKLSHDLSYNSQEIVVDGANFRHFTYYFVTPGKWKEAKAVAKEWKELYTDNSIEQGYRIYTGGLGTEELIMVVSWAESAEAYYAERAKTNETLGDVSDLRARTMAVTRKMESYDGMIRPDLSYQPKSAMAEN